MKKVRALVKSGLTVVGILATDLIARAAVSGNPLDDLKAAKPEGLSETPLPTVIGNIVTVLFSLLGIIAVVIVIYSGFQWMTSGGDEKKIKSAKDRILNAVIGMAIILLAYSITSFILTKLGQVT